MGTPLDADVAGSALRIARALDAAGVPYAIGGAIALTLHGAARATRDVDLNVFSKPEELPAVLDVLAKLGLKFERQTALAEAETEGWFSAWDGLIRIDVFVPSIDFAWEAAATRVELTFLGEPVSFLAVEALCVFKLLFFRTKDLADLERLVLVAEGLDRVRVRSKIAELMGPDDERVKAWDTIVSRFGSAKT